MKLRAFSSLNNDFTTPDRHLRNVQLKGVNCDTYTQQPLAEVLTKEIKDSGQWKVGSFKTFSDTPIENKKHHQLTGELNEQDNLQSKISPGLARLRMTPGIMREKQRHLIDQHKEIQLKGSHLNTGGGISLWPDMIQMRLTRSEILWLLAEAVTLCCLTVVLLYMLHGVTFEKLEKFAVQVEEFCVPFSFVETTNQKQFQKQLVAWHKKILHLTGNIQNHFDMSSMSSSYQVYITTYIMGLLILLYYLMDNMLAKNKLTPSRIKKCWTSMMAYGLFLAYMLERQITTCIQQFSATLATLVAAPLELGHFQAVLLYWRSRFLDNASQGLLSVFGLISVRDLLYYLQYYSVPIATVLLSPVFQLICACFTIYSQGEYMKPVS
ncbi:uncharacterized protein LOC131931743 isoform X2 [Physella acuta]|uniref:uncharacterized protein LOC131931743 isoform X2 n=1 Tax=Physella acuta TaxID=109671 RepID=UPI0027DBBBB5|nr:uncharacterized protein LOC131931743 isoform X2 [Physella acuta]